MTKADVIGLGSVLVFAVLAILIVRDLLHADTYIDLCMDETSGRFIRDEIERNSACENWYD